MHYGIIAIGSRGDVQPFVALALGLLQKGHRVTLMAHGNFKSFVQAHHVDFHPLTGNTEEMLRSPEGLRRLQSGNTFRLLRYIYERGAKLQPQVNKDLWTGCQPADVLVTSALGMPWVSSIAEKTGKPWALIQLSFPMTPTREFPFAGLDYLDFPAYNRLSYRLVRSFFWRQIKPAVNHHRQSLGLPTLKQSIFDRADSDHILTLYAVSPALLHRPSDWGPHIKVTGFLTLPSQLPPPASNAASSPEPLRRWLLAGDRPIYIGFGSIPILGPALFRQLLIDLLAFTPHRYLFCTGSSRTFDCPTHPRLLVTHSVNHEWLFPQCQAAIIHGGIGTLAAALRTATPPIIVSICGDQHWWGKLIAKRNLGHHLPFKHLSTAKLLSAIQTVLSPTITQNSASLTTQLNREDGLQNLLTSLDQYF